MPCPLLHFYYLQVASGEPLVGSQWQSHDLIQVFSFCTSCFWSNHEPLYQGSSRRRPDRRNVAPDGDFSVGRIAACCCSKPRRHQMARSLTSDQVSCRALGTRTALRSGSVPAPQKILRSTTSFASRSARSQVDCRQIRVLVSLRLILVLHSRSPAKCHGFVRGAAEYSTTECDRHDPADRERDA